MDVREWLGENNTLGIDIWERKYRYEDETFDEWLNRVSGSRPSIRQLIIDKKFLFGGRILANRGIYTKGTKLSYSNCYVIEAPEDNLESIFECAKKLARTYSYGGGCGVDLSKLAPRGAKVRNAAKESSGAVSFMDLYSLVTGLISQSGRRGALMLSMSCEHPDIEEFIDVKSDLNRVTKANISIRMTNMFMKAAAENADIDLVFKREETGEEIRKTVNARDVMKKLARNNWDMGEPGILFWDRIEGWNMLSEYENFHYAGTNPCAEEPLPAGGSCLLGSLNLAAFVKEPGVFDFDDFSEAVYAAVDALNEVLDEGLARHPLHEQRESVRDWRQIGLGIMGLADMLIKMGVEYGSEDSIILCDSIADAMIKNAVLSSCNLAAKNNTSFEKFNYEKTAASPFYRANIDSRIDNLVKQYGLYNSQLLTIAPTGTLSTMLGISGGIEPIFANYYERKTESLHGEDKKYKVYTPIVAEYMKEHNLHDEKELPSFFVTANDISYENRIKMQSMWQKRIDASISSTVNLPEETSEDTVFDLYMQAWRSGLKGITVFRNNCRRTAILTTGSKEEPKVETTENVVKYDSVTPVSRKSIGTTHGDTFCKKCACGTLYITVNRDDDGNIVETFVETSKGGICRANISAVNRLISLGMRSGVKVAEIIDQIKGIDCPACTKVKGNGVSIDGLSCPDIIARVVTEAYNNRCSVKRDTIPVFKQKHNEISSEMKCPECGEPIRHDGGCVTCPNCGYSKCS